MKLPDTLTKFYTQMLTGLKFEVGDDGAIIVGVIKGEKVPFRAPNNLPMYIPSKENINSMQEVVDGKPVLKKVLFNPLNEDAVAPSYSSRKMRLLAESKLSIAIHSAIMLLLQLAKEENAAKQANVSIGISKYLSELGKIEVSKKSKVVDDTTIEAMASIINVGLSDPSASKIMSVTVTDNKTYKGSKHAKVVAVEFPLMDTILAANSKNMVINGITIQREKDIEVYKKVFKFLLGDLVNTDGSVVTYSSDKYAPEFVAVMDMIISIATRTNSIIEELKDLSLEMYDSSYYKLYTLEDILAAYETYADSLAIVPSDTQVTVSKNKTAAAEAAAIIANRPAQHPMAASNNIAEYKPAASFSGGAKKLLGGVSNVETPITDPKQLALKELGIHGSGTISTGFRTSQKFGGFNSGFNAQRTSGFKASSGLFR